MNDFIKGLLGGNKLTYQREQPKQKTLDKAGVIAALHELESSSGTSPNIPGDVMRSYTVPGANQNEKDRFINYRVGYGGEFGLTPTALANLTKSTVDKTSPQNKLGYTGFIPGMSPDEIQKMLKTSTTTAGDLGYRYLANNKASSTDMTPDTLAQDYLNTYVTKGSPNYNNKNLERAKFVMNKYAK